MKTQGKKFAKTLNVTLETWLPPEAVEIAKAWLVARQVEDEEWRGMLESVTGQLEEDILALTKACCQMVGQIERMAVKRDQLLRELAESLDSKRESA